MTQISVLHALGLQVQQWKLLGKGDPWSWGLWQHQHLLQVGTGLRQETGDVHGLAKLSAKRFFTLFSTIFPMGLNIVFSFCFHHRLSRSLHARPSRAWPTDRRRSCEGHPGITAHSFMHGHPTGTAQRLWVWGKRGLKNPFTIDYGPGETQLVPQAPL